MMYYVLHYNDYKMNTREAGPWSIRPCTQSRVFFFYFAYKICNIILSRFHELTYKLQLPWNVYKRRSFVMVTDMDSQKWITRTRCKECSGASWTRRNGLYHDWSRCSSHQPETVSHDTGRTSIIIEYIGT